MPASAEQRNLVALAHAVETAVAAQDLDICLGDARAAAQVFDRGEGTVLARLDDALGGLLAHAGEGRNRRQECVAVNDELVGAGAVEVDALAGVTAQVHLPGKLEDDECGVLLGIKLLLLAHGLELLDLLADVVLAARDDIGVEFGARMEKYAA